jgi:beta-lactamase class C
LIAWNRRAWALVLLGLASQGARASDDDDPLRKIVDSAIRPLMVQQDIAGMAVAVAVSGRVRVFNYGVRSKESGAPVDDATLFEIGSVSKTLTATLATYAQAEGRLSLSDHPGRYIPRLKAHPIDRASLLDLGTYTAGGLPLQFPDEVANDDVAALNWLADWRPDAAPGTLRRYSDPSLGLLGYVAGIALGDGFVKSMETQLLPALGLRRSYLHVPAQARGEYAWGYRSGQPVHVNPGPFDLETYGIKTTAADMIHFVQLNIDPTALAPPLRQAVEATQVGYWSVPPLVQGLGWEQYPWPLSREVLVDGNAPEMSDGGHAAMAMDALPNPGALASPRLFDKTGSTGGFGAYVAFVPLRGIGIVMLANKSYPNRARVEAAWDILTRLAPRTR